jgi:SWI/SNF-related matrix-associated actin-dependent regulator 1 of chromatin subfamily A
VKGKLEGAIEWITDFLEQEKLVIFATHKNVVDTLYKKFHKKYNAVRIYGGTSAKERDEAVQSFQNDENTKLFIGNVQAAGTGLTLTAASNVAFLEYPWTPGELFQAESRCHRISQDSDSVNVWNLLGLDTIDEDMFQVLNKKAKVLDQVVDGADVHDSSVFDELISSYKK